MEDNNEALPEDIQNEILLRMPVKSLGKCICVSKKWTALIRGRNFRDLYFLQSKTRPRLLFNFFGINEPNMLFHSVYQEKEPLLSSGQQQTLITLEPDSIVCAVLRGLVCIESAHKIMICNPCTKKFLTLPELSKDHKVPSGRTYLGYDEATDAFKVLSLRFKRVGNTLYNDYRVFTVGSGEDCWRRIVYESDHLPLTEGLYKDGFLYFGALSIRNHNPILVSFNLGSEELNVIELPKPVRIYLRTATSFVNYNGEIALVKSGVNSKGEIRIWVRNEGAGDWREERIVIPRWRQTAGYLFKCFSLKGTIGTGELVFAINTYGIQGSMHVFYYDTITQHLRKFEIDGVDSNCYASIFLDHVDSLLLM